MSMRLMLAVLLSFSLSASVYAQVAGGNGNRRMGGQQQQPMQQNAQPVDVQGTIQGVTQGRIAVVDSNNQTRQIGIPNNAKISVTGTRSAEDLQTGTIVEFKGEIDERGLLKEKVSELAIITLSQDKQLGAVSDANLGGDTGEFGDGKKKGKPAKHKTSGAKLTPGSYNIIAKLTVGHGGKLQAVAGRSKFALELAADAKITIDSNNYMIAAPGDQVTVKGMSMPNRPNAIMASEVTIELAGAAATPSKKKAAKGDVKKPAKKPKKGDDAEQ